MSFWNVEIEGVVVGRVQGEDEQDASTRAKRAYAMQPDGSVKKFTVKQLDVKHPLVEKVEQNKKEK
jgi:hypothetical protein